MTPPASTLSPALGQDTITVSINGIKYQVPRTFSETSLNDYLRCHLLLTGTKVMCREGGCGACVVTATFPDPKGSGQVISRAINSCLCPILSCDGWEITTVEGIGDQKKPHPVQQALETHFGTQCGYCTPGMVMSMYSLLEESGGKVTSEQVEAAFGGNLCRCTGYRPILEACKTFASDSKCAKKIDMEDLGLKCHHSAGRSCAETCQSTCQYVKALPASAALFAAPWHKPTSLDELYKLIKNLSGQHIYYVVGHTGIGVYNDAPYDVYVDIKGISDLYTINNDGSKLSVGANVSLTDLINLLKDESQNSGFKYLDTLAGLLLRTAQPPVRNAGSWGGNMSMKNRHNDFPSETYIAMTIANARIFTGPGDDAHTCEEFLKLPMNGKIILRVELPTYSDDYEFCGFKVMPRAVNAHALVNAGFRAKIDRSSGTSIIAEKPALVFLNIQPSFVHAEQTEKFLTGKNIGDQQVLQQALQTLRNELHPHEEKAEASPAYKQSLALSLFYKIWVPAVTPHRNRYALVRWRSSAGIYEQLMFALQVVGDAASPAYKSAVGMIHRPVSSGKQVFDSKKENYPLNQPIPKLEAMVQCTGEAKYPSDVDKEGMLHAAFAITTEGNASIYKVDSSEAMAVPGVIRVLTATDITGKNEVSMIPGAPEEFMASKQSTYAGQPVAIVVAETKEIAETAALLVKVEYSNVREPILTPHDAIREKSFFPMAPKPIVVGDAEGVYAKAPAGNKINGDMEMSTQNHFYMETMVSVTYPTEDGLNMDAGTQYIDATQSAASFVTGLSKNKINVTVKRNGGSFGSKIFRNCHTSTATALAAYILRRPVKMHMRLDVNSYSVGKRFSYYMTYKVAFDSHGKVQAFVFDLYMNMGYNFTANPYMFWEKWGDSSYGSPNWKINMNICKTNLPQNSWCRAPGSLEAYYFLEYVMEHIAYVLKKPALEIKRLNFYKEGDILLDGTALKYNSLNAVTDLILQTADYVKRSQNVSTFNKENKWRKKGLGFSVTRYPVDWAGFQYNCNVSIYHNDGSVAVVHGGIEIGQGINTKVAQVVAYELGVDLKHVVIQPSTSISSPNAFATGGSVTSEICCLAAISACQQLKSRLQSFRTSLPKASWEELVEAAYNKGVDLFARGWASPPHDAPTAYSTYGAMCTEVEFDVLTGEYQFNRMDLVYDCGESISPYVDIGQIEGAIIMGLGYFTSEEVIYDKKTGVNLTPTTWKYKPPTSKDIPVDFRVELLRNAPNPLGVLRSKTAAEPPLCLVISAAFALRNAIQSALDDKGQAVGFWRFDTPITVEQAQQHAKVDFTKFRYAD